MARAPRTHRADDSRCRTCGAPTIRQHVEVLTVTADATPIEPGTDTQARGPNRLTWCRPPSTWSTPRLRWIYSTHPQQCPHPHHADHQCPGPAAVTLF